MGAYCPQALVSVLFEVGSRLPLDVEIGSYAGDEREHFLFMLPSVHQGDVVVLDRGYPAHDVLQALHARQIDYLIRVPNSHTFAVVEELKSSGASDNNLIIWPPVDSPKEWAPLRVRVVRLRTPGGGQSFFLTSLPRKAFGLRVLGELYHTRWEVEEFFKTLKGPYIGQGQFRSKSPSGVR